jgi:shikimate kinase
MDQVNNSFNENENVYLVGFMGSGKTHWGKAWAAATRRSFVDLDEVIEKTAGATIAEIFETKGEDHFRSIEAEALRACASLTHTIIACGGGTPCFYDNMPWMNENGLTIYISCTPAEVLQRVAREQQKRPLLKKLSKAELLFFIEQKLKEREPYYKQAKISVVSKELTGGSFYSIINNRSK